MDNTETSKLAPKIAIYGMGRAGSAFFLSAKYNHIPVDGAFSRDSSAFANETEFLTLLREKKTEILVLAVCDSKLEEVACRLSHEQRLPPIVIHLSGAFSWRVLVSLQKKCDLAQFHLLSSLSGNSPIPQKTLNGISASKLKTEKRLIELSKQMGLTPFHLPEESQALYHAAACMVGNLPIALVSQALFLLKSIGLEGEEIQHGLTSLLSSAAKNLEKQPLEKALTGPIARNDLTTVRKHIEALTNLPKSKPILDTYRLLSSQLVECMPQNDSEQLKALLKSKT